MHNQYNIIKFERFTDKKYINKDYFVVLFFIASFLIIGLIERNLILPDNGLGLLEHTNIWLFLIMNSIIPLTMNILFKTLEKSAGQENIIRLKDIFEDKSKHKTARVLLRFSIIIGFCCFIGNSLQNAHIINQLPFDYWDSTNYVLSYILSRIYKLYLFANFIPVTLTYVFVLILAVSELLEINETECYPIKNYAQLNVLCNFGLNSLLTILIPFIILSGGVYFVHNRFDITTITAISISVLSTLISLGMYILLIKKFYLSIINFKKKHIDQINLELSKIHQYICECQINEQTCEKLEIYLKKEEYLWQVEERINKLSKFPLMFKAIFTSVSPLIPALIKVIFQLLKTFFKLDILATIL